MSPRFLAAALAAAALCACRMSGREPEKTEEKHPEREEHRDEPAHEELPRRVHVEAQVIADAGIKSAPAGLEALRAVLEVPGEIVSDPDRTARVTTPVAGRIERVLFVEGQLVKARDVLALVRVPELADREAARASASARVEAANHNVARLEKLVAGGLATPQELADARALATALRSEVRAAGERLRAVDARPGSLVELRAPLGGTVVTRNAVAGQPAEVDKPIATIADLDQVWFSGRLFENDLARMRVGAEAEVQLNAYPKERFDGVVTLIGSQIDPVARTVVARVPLTNRGERLRLGLFGTARISAFDPPDVEAGGKALAVARSSVTEIDGKPYVFVHHPDDDFELHPVVLGRSALGRVEVLAGLRAGERVVVAGVFTLKSLVLKRTFAEED